MFTGIITDIGRVAAITKRDQGVRSAHRDCLGSGRHRHRRLDCLFGRLPDRHGFARPMARQPRWFEVEAWEEALRLTTIGGWRSGHAHQSGAIAEDRRRTRRPHGQRPC
jgi:riboflavin synthase